MIIFVIVLCVILFILLVVYLILKFCGLNKIYHNRSSGHYTILKKKDLRKKRGKVIDISSRETSQGKNNIPMHKNPDVTSTDPSYIIPVVKNYNLSSITERVDKFHLSKEDKKTTDIIYKKHIKNKKEHDKGVKAGKRRKNKKKHKKRS